MAYCVVVIGAEGHVRSLFDVPAATAENALARLRVAVRDGQVSDEDGVWLIELDEPSRIMVVAPQEEPTPAVAARRTRRVPMPETQMSLSLAAPEVAQPAQQQADTPKPEAAVIAPVAHDVELGDSETGTWVAVPASIPGGVARVVAGPVGAEPVETDTDALACADCVWSVDCPKSDEDIASTCSSFQPM